jgi:hypothetical protein
MLAVSAALVGMVALLVWSPAPFSARERLAQIVIFSVARRRVFNC